MKAQEQITKQSDAIKAMFMDWLRDSGYIVPESEVERQYDAELDEYPVTIGSLEYAGSHVLQKVDPIAYRCGLLDYVDSMSLDQLCDYGMDSDDYVEDIDSLWDDFEDEMAASVPTIYRLPCSYTGLDAELDNCDPPAIVEAVEMDAPQAPGYTRYLLLSGEIVDINIDQFDFADWFEVEELEELEEKELK